MRGVTIDDGQLVMMERQDVNNFSRLGYDVSARIRTRLPFARYGDREALEFEYERQERFGLSSSDNDADLNEFTVRVRNIFSSTFDFSVSYTEGESLTDGMETEAVAIELSLDLN